MAREHQQNAIQCLNEFTTQKWCKDPTQNLTIDFCVWCLIIVGHKGQLHLELEYSWVAVPFAITCSSIQTFIFETQSLPLFQNYDMYIIAWLATKVTHSPVLVRLVEVKV